MFDISDPGNFRLHFSYMRNHYQPPVDIIDIGEMYLVRIEIAGMKEEDFQIHLEKNVLLVSGVRHNPYRKHTYQQMEIHFGEFKIEIAFNVPIKSTSVTASYVNGFLEIPLEKAVAHNISITNKDEH